jgi:hypothetical protein
VTTRLTAAIVHPRQLRVLARPAADGWALPVVELAEPAWHAMHGVLGVALAAELYGGEPAPPPVLLRRLAEVDDGPGEGTGGPLELAMLAELTTDVDDPPAGWRWIDGSMVARITSLWARDAAALALASLAVAAPPTRPPWARERTGWHAALLCWTDDALAAAGRRRTGALDPEKVWSLSAVFRAETDAGAVYVKAGTPSQPLLVDEAAFTAALAERWPERLPRVLAAQPGYGWLLMADEGPPVRERADLTAPQRRELALVAARAHARLQVASVPAAAELLAAGCVDRRLSVLADQLGPLLDDPLTAAYVAPERLDQLRRREPVIRTALDRLAALDLPPSIVHGDLHLGNTLLRDGEPVFIDWTDACVGPAMVDLLTPHETSDAQLKALWREAYMEEWSTIVPRPALDEALALNDIVLPLHHAVSYRSILANIEPPRSDG